MFKHLMRGLLFVVLSYLPGLGSEIDSTDFQPHGKPILRVFSNLNTSISDDADYTSFEVRRAYLGYNYHIHPQYSIKVVLDIGSPLDDSPYSLLKRYAYFKTASLTYNWDKLSLQAGIIDLYNVGLQETYWNRRYIFKSFMDEYRFSPRADIGVNLRYRFHPGLSADFMVMNGEGYDQMQNDNTYKGAVGITASPVDRFTARVYLEYSYKNTEEVLLAFFAGYNDGNRLRAGAEANFRFSEDFRVDYDRYGYSLYGGFIIYPAYTLFVRYDWVSSNIPEPLTRPWNLARDGSALIAGIEYQPIEKVRIALNYQDWYPAARNQTNIRRLFLNLEFKL